MYDALGNLLEKALLAFLWMLVTGFILLIVAIIAGVSFDIATGGKHRSDFTTARIEECIKRGGVASTDSAGVFNGCQFIGKRPITFNE